MKSFFMSFVLFLAVSVCYSADKSLVEKAQGLKSKGDYAGAAEVHPKKLCKAIYYWNAACQIVGHRDESNDWAINNVVTAGEKEMGLALLAKAQSELDSSGEQDGTENEGCKGVDVNSLQKLINAVKKQVELK